MGAARTLPLERGVCTGVVLRRESKLQECSNLQHAAWLSSARSPFRLQPPRKQELCAAPERPDAVLAIGKVGEAEPEKARAREWMCCGFLRTSELRVPRAGRGCRPPAPQQTSPPAPRPARPPPAPSAPAAQPSVLPGGPAYLREAACPGEESSQGLRCGRSDLAPSLLARTLPPPPPPATRFRAPSRTGGHSTPGRLGKACTAAPRRAAAPPHRTGQRRAAPTRALVGPQLQRPDSGAVAITATTLGSGHWDPALKPPLPPGEPWRTSTQQQAGLG